MQKARTHQTIWSALKAIAHDVGSRLPQRVLEQVEQFAATHQGKGVEIGRCDREVAQCSMVLGRPPRTVIDVGANRGDYSAAIRAKFPECLIHAFEPAPCMQEVLRRRFCGDDRTTLYPLALASSSETRTLWSTEPGSGLASLTRRSLAHVGMSMDESTEVRCKRLDEVVQMYRIADIDWIKIDVEGHELDVLNGAGDVMRSVPLVQFEFGGCNLDTRSFFRDYWEYFTSKGFALFRQTKRLPMRVQSYSEMLEHFRTTNYIAVRRPECSRR